MGIVNMYTEMEVMSLHVFDLFTVRRRPKESACFQRSLINFVDFIYTVTAGKGILFFKNAKLLKMLALCKLRPYF
jgi:hypothetical protein